ncbi:SAM-dependent methyltransferase [Clostridia bacterium]|nr:SAM-dependent methyltransferase [Clostridia bacterium]
MLYIEDWRDYALLDVSSGERLERWGNYILIRPDPQVIWDSPHISPLWEKADARYRRSASGGGAWEYYRNIPERWTIGYNPLGLVFEVMPMGFKHMGLFPEQAANWNIAADLIKSAGRDISVLNLFAYTGGATLACARAGANVCHVDAQKAIIEICKRSAYLSKLSDAPIRYIADDCQKFVEREARRGKRYDAVILDPPSFGRGAKGETWKIEEHLYGLLNAIAEIISDKPLFVLVNQYTAGLAPSAVGYMLELIFGSRFGGKVVSDEIGIRAEATGSPFPCGGFARWES